jgi:hypothetical protein
MDVAGASSDCAATLRARGSDIMVEGELTNAFGGHPGDDTPIFITDCFAAEDIGFGRRSRLAHYFLVRSAMSSPNAVAIRSSTTMLGLRFPSSTPLR